jgi:hypothetical protein
MLKLGETGLGAAQVRLGGHQIGGVALGEAEAGEIG